MANRVFIVDDHPLVCHSLQVLVTDAPGLEYCGSANSFTEAMQKIPEAKPKLVMVDLDLDEEASGFDLIHALRDKHPHLRILVLSMLEEQRYALRVIKEGAHGYVMKSARPAEILHAISEVLAGRLAISSIVQQQMLAALRGGRPTAMQPQDVLSGREWQVFECLGKGFTIKQTAEALNISEKTANSYCERIKVKMGVDRLRKVTQMAYDWLRGRKL